MRGAAQLGLVNLPLRTHWTDCNAIRRQVAVLNKTWLTATALLYNLGRGIFATAAQKMLFAEAELLTSSGARWSIRLVCCRRRAAKGIEVGEEARAPTNSRQCHGPGDLPRSAVLPLVSTLPRLVGGAFSCGPATKKNPEQLTARGSREVVASVWASGRATGCRGGSCRSAEPL